MPSRPAPVCQTAEASEPVPAPPDWGALAQSARAQGAPRPPAPLRLVAVGLPVEQANQARARVRRTARRKGRTPHTLSLLLAGYVLVLTDLPADSWDAATVLALYRARWQVELVFKRLKGLWQLATPRVRAAARVQAVLLGVLLAVLLAERVVPPPPPWFAAVDRPVSLWRWTGLWRQVVLQALPGTLPRDAVAGALRHLQRHLCDPPRRRPQQAASARQRLTAPLLPRASSPTFLHHAA